MEYETITDLEKEVEVTEEDKQEQDRLLHKIVRPNIIIELGKTFYNSFIQPRSTRTARKRQ
jgi:hypothetical protein